MITHSYFYTFQKDIDPKDKDRLDSVLNELSSKYSVLETSIKEIKDKIIGPYKSNLSYLNPLYIRKGCITKNIKDKNNNSYIYKIYINKILTEDSEIKLVLSHEIGHVLDLERRSKEKKYILKNINTIKDTKDTIYTGLYELYAIGTEKLYSEDLFKKYYFFDIKKCEILYNDIDNYEYFLKEISEIYLNYLKKKKKKEIYGIDISKYIPNKEIEDPLNYIIENKILKFSLYSMLIGWTEKIKINYYSYVSKDTSKEEKEKDDSYLYFVNYMIPCYTIYKSSKKDILKGIVGKSNKIEKKLLESYNILKNKEKNEIEKYITTFENKIEEILLSKD